MLPRIGALLVAFPWLFSYSVGIYAHRTLWLLPIHPAHHGSDQDASCDRSDMQIVVSITLCTLVCLTLVCRSVPVCRMFRSISLFLHPSPRPLRESTRHCQSYQTEAVFCWYLGRLFR
ncbi:hypothetical protein BD408DRAFT_419838 [Parasitella parasitica]|nr:hypothetical protein BD408DRAFT_419838 [Parasitella parasitica]